MDNVAASDAVDSGARLGGVRLARPAKTGGERRSRYAHLPRTGHARLHDCLNVTLLGIDAVASHIPTMWFGPRPPCRNKKRLSTALPLRNLAAPASLLPVRPRRGEAGTGQS